MNRSQVVLKGGVFLEFFCRWFLGICFIYASVHKIADPEAFAKVVYGYSLFPHDAINLIAVVVPFLEFTAGVFLCLGLFVEGAALALNGLLISFVIAISINIARGHVFDCGCFSVGEGVQTSPEDLLVRDLVFLACGLFVLFYKGDRGFMLRMRGLRSMLGFS